jgi:hypothetical protein
VLFKYYFKKTANRVCGTPQWGAAKIFTDAPQPKASSESKMARRVFPPPKDTGPGTFSIRTARGANASTGGAKRPPSLAEPNGRHHPAGPEGFRRDGGVQVLNISGLRP